MDRQPRLQNLPIGIQNFESLRTDGYLYVDKTELIYRLATTGRYYFLSRPRRFGKSLLMSTIHAYFSGRRDLFKGLAMEELESEWLEYPVLHLDLNNLEDISMDERYVSICGITQNELETALHPYVEKFAQKQGISVEDAEERLREHCAGYHFCEDTEEIYNPAGLHNCLTQKDFNYCWFETGTPSF